MIDRIISFSIHNKSMIGFGIVALLAWGGYSLLHLPIDALPDITNNQVQVITVAPTLASQEVEQFITYPVEASLATMPDVVELRSISRFGLSVVTVVFKDAVDVYKGRQMVGERLKEAEEQIPEGMGTPQMAPVTTGLGEIYQYVLHPKLGYDSLYNSMALRTIQDWIVRRQLLGTPGVADVSSFGGFLKEYEVSINPEKLKSMNIGLTEIFDALSKNNQNTGGAYIDKKPNATFIRGIGMATELPDIEKIVIKSNSVGIPILIRDVAKVQFGHAVRYGAMTRNDEGEVVGGIVLMLKGANSNEVIQSVKERIKTIEKSLPEGIAIEPFLDRTKLVNNAIGTVTTNLIEGGLIVVFVLVLLLGNMRAGLVVASVIPLSMLFAVGMMNTFGVSGNLMSLGAIDFGLIVDGAVIIVENVIHRLTGRLRNASTGLTQAEMDSEVYGASRTMMSSAAFGQMIILIVYLPILALVGIEGKMFKPMAETVAFAILGALILSLTYVPMISSLFLSKSIGHKTNWSDLIMEKLQKLYSPSILWSLAHKKIVVSLSFLTLIISIFIFSRMGGEFIPTLEEGDFATETRLMSGASLLQTVETMQKGAAILKKDFPEVKEVIGKIGASEIPTDPMPIESGDMMIILKDKKDWTSAKTREKLAEKMSEALSVIPGVEFGFQQPIQMRFNELMTGAKQDVAIKIFGEDLDALSQYAEQTSRLITPIQGVEDIFVEKVTGLPQIQVIYDRDRISKYGLHIADINQVLKTAFAGEKAGVVFEGEKRFDLVVRYEEEFRQTIDNVRNLYVTLPGGSQIPLDQVARVDYQLGPAQISREDAKRRITVGFNVRNRDVESIVEEIQMVLTAKLKLDPGYYITYGGQFQNLIEAKKRLSVAVPAALILILIILFLTFRSIKEALLIYTAIPLAAIGGVFALYLRGMPFSISAGIGFIALFGVAVLNGIVLISYFNQLEKEGEADIITRVLKGTTSRLRPVIMTAAVASLGFLPMAISSSSGAEVQKPLATVVIGGLLSSTLLTLIVLPVLYVLFARRKKINLSPVMAAGMGFLVLSFASPGFAQEDVRRITANEAVSIALESSPKVRKAILQTDRQSVLTKSAFDFGKTEVFYESEETKSGVKGNSRVGVRQEINFPTVYFQQYRLQNQNRALSELELKLVKAEVTRDVRIAYDEWVFAQEQLRLVLWQDSLYGHFVKATEIRLNTGETSSIEAMAARAQYQEIKVLRVSLEASLLNAETALRNTLGVSYHILPSETTLRRVPWTAGDSTASSGLYEAIFNQSIAVTQSQAGLEKQALLPDISLGYFRQRVAGMSGFHGVEAGLRIPLWFLPNAGRIQASNRQVGIAEQERNAAIRQRSAEYESRLRNLKAVGGFLDYYENEGLSQSDALIQVADKNYKSGDIGYLEYLQLLQKAIAIRAHYLEYLHQFNETVITLNYMTEGK